MKEDDLENKSVYNKFIAWMKRSWYGLPDSEELLTAVKSRYSEEEAALLTGMPFSPKNVRELAAQKGMAPAELARALDAMAQKGLVFRMKKGEELFYGLNDGFLVFLRSSFWPGRMDEHSRRVAPRVNAYFHAGLLDPYEGVRTRGLRAIPVETALDIEAGKKILPYEDVAKVLEEQSEFCVAVCPCRHRKNLDPAAPDCKYSTENCLHFGTLLATWWRMAWDNQLPYRKPGISSNRPPRKVLFMASPTGARVLIQSATAATAAIAAVCGSNPSMS